MRPREPCPRYAVFRDKLGWRLPGDICTVFISHLRARPFCPIFGAINVGIRAVPTDVNFLPQSVYRPVQSLRSLLYYPSAVHSRVRFRGQEPPDFAQPWKSPMVLDFCSSPTTWGGEEAVPCVLFVSSFLWRWPSGCISLSAHIWLGDGICTRLPRILQSSRSATGYPCNELAETKTAKFRIDGIITSST